MGDGFRQADKLQDFVDKAQVSLERTYGYRQLSDDNKNNLLRAVERYAEEWDGNKDLARLSDMIGLNVQSVEKIVDRVNKIKAKNVQ